MQENEKTEFKIDDYYYFSYYKDLLVNENMKQSTFEKMIKAQRSSFPQFFRIKADNSYGQMLKEEISVYVDLLKEKKIDASIITCLQEKYGTYVKICANTIKMKQDPMIDYYLNLIHNNIEYNFITQYHFSSLLPYLFLDVQPDDFILSCALNYSAGCEILSEILKDGYIFINEKDYKLEKENYVFEYPNYCTIQYNILEIPYIQKFDKVLCISPSIQDGIINFQSGEHELDWSLEKAAINHKDSKKYLISALEKVKINGICIYATHSLNPFENECVINSVLQMPQFEGKFELIDCSTILTDIKRKKGLTRWNINEISHKIDDEELIKSLSCESLVENIDRCMRFYPHQIDGSGTFIAVIKKLDEIENFYTKPIQDSNKRSFHSQFSKASKSLVEKIAKDFGLTNEFDDFHLVFCKSNQQMSLTYVNQNLINFFNDDSFKLLRICSIGSLAFTIKDSDLPFIPSIHLFNSNNINYKKRNIVIDINEFEELVEYKQIPLIKIKNENNMQSFEDGGVLIVLEKFGPITGGLIENQFLKVLQKPRTLSKLIKIARVFIANMNKKQLKEIESMKEEIQNRNALNQEQQNQIGQLEDEINMLKKSFDDKMNEIDELKEMNKNTNDLCQSQQNQIQQLEDEIDKLENSGRDKLRQIDKLKEMNKNTNELCKSQQNQIGKLEDEIDKLENAGKDKLRQIDKLKEMNKNTNELCQTRQNQIGKLEDEIKKIKKSLENKMNEIDKLKGMNKSQNDLCQTQETRIKHLEDELNKIKKSDESKSSVINVLNKTKQNQTEQIQKKRKNLFGLKKENKINDVNCQPY